MLDRFRLSATQIGVTAGILGAATTFALAGGASPLGIQLANSTETPGDVSGPCDEAEHADDSRCVGVDVPVTDSSTSTSSTIPSTGGVDVSGPCDEAEHADDPRCAGVDVPAADGPTSTSTTIPSTAPGGDTRVVDASGAGTVTYTVSGGSFQLVSATPNAGWRVDVEQSAGIEIDLDFRSGTQRVQVDIEFEHGAVRERIRFRDDADDTRLETTNGTVTDTRSDDDDSGSGSSGSSTDDRDDNSGSGSGDDDRSGSSGHGSDDDRDSGSNDD